MADVKMQEEVSVRTFTQRINGIVDTYGDMNVDQLLEMLGVEFDSELGSSLVITSEEWK